MRVSYPYRSLDTRQGLHESRMRIRLQEGKALI